METLEEGDDLCQVRCHEGMDRGRLVWTYVSREWDMSWGHLTPVLTDNLKYRGIRCFYVYSEGLFRLVELSPECNFQGGVLVRERILFYWS